MRVACLLIALLLSQVGAAHANDIPDIKEAVRLFDEMRDIEDCPHVQSRADRLLLSRSSTPKEDELRTSRGAEFVISFPPSRDRVTQLIYISHLLPQEHETRCRREAIIFTDAGLLEVGTHDWCADPATRTKRLFGSDPETRERIGSEHKAFWLERLKQNMEEISTIAAMCRK